MYSSPGGEAFGQLRHRLADQLRGRKRVRAGPLEHRKRNGRIEIEIGIRRIVERRQFDLRDILHSHNCVRGLLDHDVAELGGVRKTAERLHRDLERAGLVDRRLIQDAGRDLDVLALQGERHIVGGQPERLQLGRIEPDAHGIVAAAEHGDRAHAVDSSEHVLDLQRRVVGDEEIAARFIRRNKMHDHHQVGRAFGHRHADVAHVGRQARLGDRDAVLHLHLRDVEIGADVERHLDRETAVARRVRRDIKHVLDAVDLLLDRSDHGRGHDFGTCAGILTRDVDDRRRDLGILRDRQPREGDRAEDHEHDRHHGGKDRPIDEEMGHPHESEALRRLVTVSWSAARRTQPAWRQASAPPASPSRRRARASCR